MRDTRGMTIEEMQNIALKKGGKCLSKNYLNRKTKLTWECKEGHVWEATPASVKSGSWCPKCSRFKKGYARKLSIEDMRVIAQEKGGECLSKKYIDSKKKLK